jgi:formylglycine-generating enzyme required for sulfatase activity
VKLKVSGAVGAPVSETVRLYSNSHALVIGIDNYTNGWPRLSNAVKDAQLIERELRGRGFNVQLKTNLAAGALEEALENFFIDKGADPNARLLVWFAGHGHTERGKGYLVPADGPLPQKDTRGFRRKALSMRRIGDMVRDADAKHVLAVFDSCFAGTVFESARTAPPPAITRVTTQPVRQFLTSGDAGQTVADDGKFRRLFIEALQGKRSADANADGYLTASELGLYLTDSISNYTSNKQTPHYGKLRDPDFDRGDFVFKMASLGRVAARVAPGGGMTAEVAFWQSIKDSGNPAMFEEFLRQFPSGHFAGLAKLNIESLKSTQIASLPPTPEPGFEVTDMGGRFIALKRANVRAEPNAKARKVTTLEVEALVTVTGRVEGADWLRIAHAGGDAYVWKPLLATLNVAEFSAWLKVKRSRRYKDIEKYLKKYPKGLFADRASRLLAALTPVAAPAPQVAVARPAPVPAPRPQSLQPGTTFRDCDGAAVASAGTDLPSGASFCGPQMVVVPAGAFDMGDLNGGGHPYEKPVHHVTIPRPFAVGVYEVTQAEWRSVMGSNPSDFKGERNPVEKVSWDDAKDFLRRLSTKTGKEYRLLSEAEWEYVARAGSRTKYPWGNGIDLSKAKHGVRRTGPVGSYVANAFGLYDTVGNVWEWTEDCWNKSYSGAPSNGNAWTTGGCHFRVLRGGGWRNSPWFVRSAYRIQHDSGDGDHDYGFRIARTVSR